MGCAAIPCLYLYMDVKPGNTSVTNVHITGNTSDSRGGGIGSNGTVIIGGEYTPPETFSVTKEWTNGCPTNLKQLNIWLLGMDKKDPSKVVYVAYNQLYGTFESNTTSAWRDKVDFDDLSDQYDYMVLEEAVYDNGDRVWSDNGKTHEDVMRVVRGVMDVMYGAGSEFIWSDAPKSLFESEITGPDDNCNYQVTNTSVTPLLKLDASTGKELSGAVLSLYKDGELVIRWTTEDKPLKRTLEDGKYRLHEETAPEGYELAEDVIFTVENGEAVTEAGAGVVVMLDKPKPKPPEKNPDDDPQDDPQQPEQKPDNPTEDPQLPVSTPSTAAPSGGSSPSYPSTSRPNNPASQPEHSDTPAPLVPEVKALEMVAITDDDNPRTFMTPMTGDNRPVGVAVLLGLLALCMMGVFGILGFRKKDENK